MGIDSTRFDSYALFGDAQHRRDDRHVSIYHVLDFPALLLTQGSRGLSRTFRRFCSEVCRRRFHIVYDGIGERGLDRVALLSDGACTKDRERFG
jgi:hypothetical protein